ncbi:hypothetical protein MAHJHV58_49080 [Mycobacterium avium subsp. hominissuis]|uniref:hypothetical protein n=1 Tax=Mycobacterium avium TaxID=1764 RepID=UPI000BAF4F1F|nr:hypothetical protein [Mycobacterium avium]PBA38810.1 hypothetical protein CKJ63_25445 [Mycobacterium avium]PBA78721.1 hypothetical protein CKJ72_25485 [Mycobacterium avium]
MDYPHPEDLWEPRNHTAGPVDCIKSKAKVQVRDGVKWITYRDEIRRARKTIPVIVEMPENAATKSCHEGRHHQCNHRRGARHEGGVWLKVTKPAFIWRCGCLCHAHPERIGLLF